MSFYGKITEDPAKAPLRTFSVVRADNGNRFDIKAHWVEINSGLVAFWRETEDPNQNFLVWYGQPAEMSEVTA